MSSELTIWDTERKDLVPNTAKTPAEITNYAVQLKDKDKMQLVSAFDLGHYDMGLIFLWSKTIAALKSELATVGVGLLGEMLGKTDVDEDDDIEDILTTKDAIRLSEELGVVTTTEALRLRQSFELITHFSQLSESDFEEITEDEAKSSLRNCVKSVLARPKVEVAKTFVEFRGALENKTFADGEPQLEMLLSSPYFFKKLTISILLNAAKSKTGAQLEHALANINILLPSMWKTFRDTERWQVGHTYAEVYADGKTSSVSALKAALMKVKGFDFVPENLRSDTFVKAAEAILKAHDGMNNFHYEYSPTNSMAKLGSTIPTPALPACMTALLSVALGNSFGHAWNAVSVAEEMLMKISHDRWQYYLNQALPGDTRILNKLVSPLPQSRWFDLINDLKLSDIQIKNRIVAKLIKASLNKKSTAVEASVKELLLEFYGEKK